jgi:Na+-driven multidrug efflux pump
MRLIATVQAFSVAMNIVLAPALIMGTPFTAPLGVIGAGLASSISVALVLVASLRLWLVQNRQSHLIANLLAARWLVWRRMLVIGLPAAGESFALYAHVSLVYWAASHWGGDLQAAVGIGSRVIQTLVVPSLAVAYAAAPVAGQNYGAGHLDRVGRTFWTALLMGGAIMAPLTLLCCWQSRLLVSYFTNDPAIADWASQFVQLIACSFVAQGVAQTCSAVFQALGRTIGVLISSISQLSLFGLGIPWLLLPQGSPAPLWEWAAASTFFQAGVSLVLLQRSWSTLKLPRADVAC